MTFGCILGLGERYHPLPWKTLTYDTDLGGYVADVSREQLEAALSFGRSVYDYYGIAYPGIM
jgi:hypothetical protein